MNAAAWFVWRGSWRAEFVSFAEAFEFARVNGGELTTDPMHRAAPIFPSAGQIAMAESYGSSSGEE